VFHIYIFGLECYHRLSLRSFTVFANFLCHQVLKVAILAEKYANDYTWYVDTILHLIRIAGDHVSEEVPSTYIYI